MKTRMFASLAAALLATAVSGANAGDIKVLSAMGMKSILQAVQPKFEAKTGHRLVIQYDTAGLVRKRIVEGERADVVFVQKTWMDSLKNASLAVDSSVRDLATSPVGLVARSGTVKEDISSRDKLIAVLRKAQSIGYTDPKAGGLSGSHFARLVTQLGMDAEVNRKAILGSPMARVSSGEVEYAVLQVSEILTLKGPEFIGPFPEELQETTPVSVAVLKAAESMAPANELVAFMEEPAVSEIFREKGMRPSKK